MKCKKISITLSENLNPFSNILSNFHPNNHSLVLSLYLVSLRKYLPKKICIVFSSFFQYLVFCIRSLVTTKPATCLLLATILTHIHSTKNDMCSIAAVRRRSSEVSKEEYLMTLYLTVLSM